MIIGAPVDLAANFRGDGVKALQLNHYYLDTAYTGELLATFEAIRDAMNTDNHDRSDTQSDYFDVGHYIAINVGKWDKPFIVK